MFDLQGWLGGLEDLAGLEAGALLHPLSLTALTALTLVALLKRAWLRVIITYAQAEVLLVGGSVHSCWGVGSTVLSFPRLWKNTLQLFQTTDNLGEVLASEGACLLVKKGIS